MAKHKVVRFFNYIPSTYTHSRDYEKGIPTIGLLAPVKTNVKLYSEGSGKKSSREEQQDAMKMPGFVHPQTTHEEGHFTQKAKQQLKELKKKLNKPTIENTQKKE